MNQKPLFFFIFVRFVSGETGCNFPEHSSVGTKFVYREVYVAAGFSREIVLMCHVSLGHVTSLWSLNIAGKLRVFM